MVAVDLQWRDPPIDGLLTARGPLLPITEATSSLRNGPPTTEPSPNYDPLYRSNKVQGERANNLRKS